MTRPAPQVEPEEFTFADYVLAQQAINAAYATAVYPIVAPYENAAVTARQWAQIVAVLYTLTRHYRYESAEIARKFYDSERARNLPGLTRPVFEAERLEEEFGFPVDVVDITKLTVPDVHPVFLARYEPEWFEEAMASVEKDFRKPRTAPDIPREKITLGKGTFKVLATGLKEIENGGRATLLEAVNSDRLVRGWARVAGGGESCSFCEMLISRGPVYSSAQNAGLDAASDKSAVDIYDQWDETGDDALLDQLMHRWHENCDCKVVPVFKFEDWPGRNEYLDALDLWREATEGFSGRDAMNAFRRRIEGRAQPASTPRLRLVS